MAWDVPAQRRAASTAPAGPLTTARDLAEVIDDVPAVVALFDMDLRNRFTNWAHVAWFGLHPHELIGCSPADIVGDAVFAEAKPFYDAARAGEPQTFERIMTLPGGGRRHSVVNYVPHVVDGEIRGVITMASDVTGRVRTDFARHELATRAAAIGVREQHAMAKQRTATERLNQMADELAVVADRHPDLAAAVHDAARAMGEAAQRLRTLAAHRPGPGRPPGPERVIRERVEAAAGRLGFLPSLLVMGSLDALPDDLADLVGQTLDITLDNIARHADAGRVDITVSVEHGDVVVVVADDGGGLVRPQQGSGLDRLRELALARDGRCSWYINSDDGTTVEWRAPTHTGPPVDVADTGDVVAVPVDAVQRPPAGYRGTGLELDDVEMRTLLEHLPIGLAVWNADICNQYANALAARWFGLPDPADMLGRQYGEFVDRRTYERAMPMAEAALAGSHVVVERPFEPGAGRPKYMRAEFLPRIVDGVVAGLTVQVTDIGERVRAESAMRAEQARVEALRERHAAEEAIHHLAIQEVFAAAMRLDTLRPAGADARADLDNALAPLDGAVADLRESVVTTGPDRSGIVLAG